MKRIANFMKSRRKLIDTSITIRTQYLRREIKEFFGLNVKLSLLALLSSLITAITSIAGSTDTLQSDVANDIPNWPLNLMTVATVLLSVSALISTVKTSNPTKFVNKIIADQYDAEEYTAIFIIKMVFDNIPKILVFRSESWNSYFLPYCHYDPEKIEKSDYKQGLKVPLSEVLEINENDFEIFDNFKSNDYVAIKKNPSHEGKRKITYHFFYVKFLNPYAYQRFFSGGSSYFSWKSKYELVKDIDTRLNNGDVVEIIDELSLLNQSKLAFKENVQSSFDVPSRYRIIWNITSECYFLCPICATNSGNDDSHKCSISYEDKLKILINLSSINGYIDHLDISGGDPLKNPDDRNIIKKINRLFPYTDVSVTTTGKALESISIDELLQTVKTCDITYDIPYNICIDEFKKYREYQYNYTNFKQIERFSKSGVKIALNIHIPILPATIDKEIIATILEDLNHINPVQIKFIRLMPVGRMGVESYPSNYNPEQFLQFVQQIIDEKSYKFKLAYNCSLGVKVQDTLASRGTCRHCEMLKSKLGIDSCGHVYSCIWGAYIPEFLGKDPKENPFYLGDLKEDTLYDIITSPKVIKLAKQLEQKADGCRVYGYVMDKEFSGSGVDLDCAMRRMLQARDTLSEIHSTLSIES